MPSTARQVRDPSTAPPGETAHPPAGDRARSRGGLLAAAALAASCLVTTALVGAGVAAGAGLAGSLELTVAAIAVPATLLGWQALRRRRRRTVEREERT